MKSSTTRNIPPPINLGVSGSNMHRTRIPPSPSDGEELEIAVGHHPYVYRSRHIIDVDGSTSPVPLLTPSTATSSSSGPVQVLTPSTSTASTLMTSTSGGSFLSASEWDGSRLVPNRRRRSYSESGYSPHLPFSHRSVSGPSCSRVSLTSTKPNCPTDAPSPRTSSNPSFTLGFKNKFRTSISSGPSDPLQHPRQRISAGGRRSKLWSSITHLPLSAGIGLEFGNPGRDANSIGTPRKKSRRPGTSPSTPSTFVDTNSPYVSVGSTGGIVNGESPKKRQRPGTASSTASGSGSSSRTSKLDWHWRWRRLSLLKSSSSTSSSSPQPSLSFTPTMPSSSPSPPPTPPKSSHRSPHTKLTARHQLRESTNLRIPPSPSSRNRSTPHLQAPDLSMEDLGKVNAFYAPPPPACAVQALSDTPRRRAVSSGPKVKPTVQLPLEVPKAPKYISKPLPVPIRTNVNAQNLGGKGISIALPLSPINSVGGRCDDEEDSGVIYLTVEDDWDEENGEAMLRLVEFPM